MDEVPDAAGSSPVLRILGPRDGMSVLPEIDRVTITALVEMAAPWVDVTIGAQRVRVLRGALFQVEVALADGLNVFALRAIDAAGNEARPLEVRVIRDLAPAPAWYRALAKDARPALPLPAGLAFGEPPGEYVNEPDGTVLVWIPAGRFSMGSPARATDGHLNERPLRRIAFSRGYFLGKHPITWEQYRAHCMATGREAPRPGFEVDGRHPVHGVSWEDAQAYAAWAGLRLPSEAEWEHAARGSDGRAYPWGDAAPDPTRLNAYDASCPEDFGWPRAAWRDGWAYSAPVGSFPAGASPFGCHDMAGNVWEWVQDGYRARHEATPRDGSAWEGAGGAERVLRGGSWFVPAERGRAAGRDRAPSGGRYWDVGFRLARSP